MSMGLGLPDPRNEIRSLDELTKKKKKDKEEEAKKLEIKKAEEVKAFEKACQNPLDPKNAAKIAQKGQKNQPKTAGNTAMAQ